MILLITFLSIARIGPIPVPPAVAQAFATQFPRAHLKKWETISTGYQAIFRLKDQKCLAIYTASAVWKETDYPVKWTRQLPTAVRTGWRNSGYVSWELMGIRKIVTPAQTWYTMHVGEVQSLGPDDTDIGSEYILYFSPEGELVRKERVG
jgi:hypothetical protein